MICRVFATFCALNVSIVRRAVASSACSARSTTPRGPPSRRLCRSARKAVATFCQFDMCISQIKMSYLYVHNDDALHCHWNAIAPLLLLLLSHKLPFPRIHQRVMGRLVHTGLGSSSLVAYVLHYPPPPPANSFVIGTAVINTQTHLELGSDLSL